MSSPTTRPVGTDPLAQQIGDAAGTAADIEAAPARRDADAIEHRQRIGRHALALDAQPLDLAGAMLERVVAGEGVRASLGVAWMQPASARHIGHVRTWLHAVRAVLDGARG